MANRRSVVSECPTTTRGMRKSGPLRSKPLRLARLEEPLPSIQRRLTGKAPAGFGPGTRQRMPTHTTSLADRGMMAAFNYYPTSVCNCTTTICNCRTPNSSTASYFRSADLLWWNTPIPSRRIDPRARWFDVYRRWFEEPVPSVQAMGRHAFWRRLLGINQTQRRRYKRRRFLQQIRAAG